MGISEINLPFVLTSFTCVYYYREEKKLCVYPYSAPMDPCFPDWNFEPDLLPFANQKRPSSTNEELMELVWQNGQVVMQSQTHRRPGMNHLGSQQLPQKSDTNDHHQNTDGSYANSSTLIQDDETVTWINYPIEDPFEVFCSPFFTADLPSPGPIQTVASKPAETMVRQRPLASQFGGARDVQECSSMTVGSSHCESNEVIGNDPDFSRASSNETDNTVGLIYSQLFTEDNIQQVAHEDKGRKKQTLVPTTITTTSSGGSESSFDGIDKSSAGPCGQKRKGRDTENSDCQRKADKLVSGSEKRPSTRRCRAAEVHNLSERRRRDRINEKMKALQELIPHCNKTDKASMLDEAIEYMKSLQLQLQVICTRSGMAAPIMFPAMQPYVSPMGMGLGPHQLAFNSIHQSLSMAPPNPNAMYQTLALNPMNFQNQMQTQSCLHEQFARYVGVHQLQQVAASQAHPNPQMNAVAQGGSSMVQPSGGLSTGDASSGNKT
ncbi:hypothetical protein SAY86_010545 [Trapa natans]|uniref:BHLH domain-containing protein n=1 Tax=Trapa natans TaxID=22666 RepID=A0AAN7LV74_TRANT|nr:hypothetical protein SAY86_010545 [Trapa natans]